MSIEPYRYASGEVHGDDPEVDPWDDPTKTPGPARHPGRQPARGRGTSTLVLRARRAKTDPDWASRSKETQRLLLEIDREDARR